jgi:hypothetical protein
MPACWGNTATALLRRSGGFASPYVFDFARHFFSVLRCQCLHSPEHPFNPREHVSRVGGGLIPMHFSLTDLHKEELMDLSARAVGELSSTQKAVLASRVCDLARLHNSEPVVFLLTIIGEGAEPFRSANHDLRTSLLRVENELHWVRLYFGMVWQWLERGGTLQEFLDAGERGKVDWCAQEGQRCAALVKAQLSKETPAVGAASMAVAASVAGATATRPGEDLVPGLQMQSPVGIPPEGDASINRVPALSLSADEAESLVLEELDECCGSC